MIIMNFIYLFPLQLQEFNISDYVDNPMRALVFLIFIAGLAAIIIYLNVSKRVKNSKAFKTGKVGEFKHGQAARDEKEAEEELRRFERHAKVFQLKKEEAVTFKEILDYTKTDVEKAVKNIEVLDAAFKAYYVYLEKEARSAPEAYEKLREVFHLRNIISCYDVKDGAKRQRFSMRKKTNIQCVCTEIIESKEKEKGKIVKKLKSGKDKFNGVLIDVSSGGCAVRAEHPVSAGSKIKIEFKIGNANIAALGEIIRINRSAHGAVSHISFLVVHPKTYAVLGAFIFGYS